ncbi:MAG: NUDIX hydrolase [Pseudomonadota bacterium]
MTREYPDRPIAAVGVIVLRGDQVLLIKRANPPKPDEWSLPGGAQDIGETVRDAARREVLEETGLKINIGGLVDVVDFIERDDAGQPRYHYSLIDFWAESHNGEAAAGDDAAQTQWTRLADIDALPLWPETQRVIHRAAHLRDDAAKEGTAHAG